MYKRCGIYQVRLSQGEKENPEICPCLVISNNISNEFSPVVTIIPLVFSSLDKIYEFETFLPAVSNGLGKDAKISSHLIITINKSRVIGERIGFLPKSIMANIDKTLRMHLDL